MKRTPQWKKPVVWDLSVRDDTSRAKSSRFAGTIVYVGFELIENASAGETLRKWHVRYDLDGSSSLSSARSPRYLSRDSFPVGAVPIDSVVAEIETHGSAEQLEDYQTPVTITREAMNPVATPSHYLPKPIIGKLFRQAVDATDDPSPELFEQLEAGSPRDWVT